MNTGQDDLVQSLQPQTNRFSVFSEVEQAILALSLIKASEFLEEVTLLIGPDPDCYRATLEFAQGRNTAKKLAQEVKQTFVKSVDKK